jgi:hypothetical protein
MPQVTDQQMQTLTKLAKANCLGVANQMTDRIAMLESNFDADTLSSVLSGPDKLNAVKAALSDFKAAAQS